MAIFPGRITWVEQSTFWLGMVHGETETTEKMVVKVQRALREGDAIVFRPIDPALMKQA